MSTIRFRELTAVGSGGVSVFEVRGPGARARLAERWPGIARIAPGGLGLVVLEGGDSDVLDEALASVLGEDAVELSLHGAPVVVAVVRAALSRLPGFVDADAGPESGRGATAPGPEAGALEARAAQALARTDTDAAARVLLDQAGGALRRELERLARASEPELGQLRAELERRARLFERLARPTVVLLAGPVNAGKSTLFNVLVGAERVVVSEEPGTTRDLVGERMHLGAWPVELVDSAGERELDEALVSQALADPARADPLEERARGQARVELAGQERARELRGRADLVLWLEPAGAASSAPAVSGSRVVAVASRCREAGVGESGVEAHSAGAAAALRISALECPRQAVAAITELFHQTFELPTDPWLPGAGVPFEAVHLGWIEELCGLAEPRRGERLRELLSDPTERTSIGLPH